jgi:hypothetical protein
MCVEAVWWRCHRRIISDYLIANGKTVFHILGHNHIEPAHLTEAARSGSAGALIYPVSCGSLTCICMSALGQKQTSRPEISMSALPPKADIGRRVRHVRFVPKADIARARQRPGQSGSHAMSDLSPKSAPYRTLTGSPLRCPHVFDSGTCKQSRWVALV